MDESEKIDLHAEPPARLRVNAARWLMALVGGVPALATVLAFGGRWSWQLDLLSHFRVQYAFILAIMVMLLFFKRQRRLGLVLAVPLAINLGLILPLYFHPGWLMPHQEMSNEEVGSQQGPTLRLMLYHLDGRLGDSDQTQEMIRNSVADLIVLTAVEPAELENIQFTVAPFRLYQAHATRDGHGVAVLVRVSIRPQVRIVDASLVPLTDKPEESAPQAMQVRFLWQGRPLVLLAVSASNALSASHAALQATEFDHVARWARLQNTPVIVAGDLNTTPWSYGFRQLLAKSGLKNSQLGFGIQGTWPGMGNALGQIPLDHCLTDLSLMTAGRKVGASQTSSHQSLLITLKWAGGASDPEQPTIGEQADGGTTMAHETDVTRQWHREAGQGSQVRPEGHPQGRRHRPRRPKAPGPGEAPPATAPALPEK